jgi:hypothetical protein
MKVLFFAPHSAIWIHAFPEALIAEALQDSGHEIVYVTCGRQLKTGCICMSAYGVLADASEEQRNKICDRCDIQKTLLKREMKLNGSEIAAEISAAETAEIDRLLATVRQDNILDIEIDGIAVGRAALYEFLLEHKKSTLGFDNAIEWVRYQATLRNALYAFFAARRIIEREKPDTIVVYNALYSVNRITCQLAAAQRKPFYFLHAGGNLAHRLQTLMIAKGDIFSLMHQAIDLWPSLKDGPIDADAAHLVTDHFIELLKGKSVFAYSSPQTGNIIDLRKRLGIGADQKVLCATLSSSDERFAAETIGARAPVKNLLYSTQVDWVRSLIDYAKDRPELFLVIRVHPREFPNKREDIKSVHAYQLEALFQQLPANVVVNWPADNLSLYDLAEITDVFLNAWSSAGKEMALLGIPVVSYSSELPLYPVDIEYLGETETAYYSAIERAVSDGWRYENIVRIYRWCAIEYKRMLIDISDAFDTHENATASLAKRVFSKVMRTIDPYRQQKDDCRRRPHPIAARGEVAAVFELGARSRLDIPAASAASTTTASAETSIIANEIARILDVMYPNTQLRQSRLGCWLVGIASTPRHA